MSKSATRFEVRSFETDPAGRLTLPALCAYLQEAARRNATQMGAGQERLARDGLAWVLHRLKLEITALPCLDDGVEVDTWATSWDTVVGQRDFEVRAPGGRRLVAGTSRWVIVDLAQRRVTRLPDFVRACPLPARPPLLTFDAPEPQPPEHCEHERRLDVRRADLDMVGHANNTRYVEWALEPLPDACVSGTPTAFEIVFRRESRRGDRLASRACAMGASRFAHALVRLDDGTPLAHATSAWHFADPAS